MKSYNFQIRTNALSLPEGLDSSLFNKSDRLFAWICILIFCCRAKYSIVIAIPSLKKRKKNVKNSPCCKRTPSSLNAIRNYQLIYLFRPQESSIWIGKLHFNKSKNLPFANLTNHDLSEYQIYSQMFTFYFSQTKLMERKTILNTVDYKY